MSKEDVMGIKAMSKAKDSSESPWNSKDPEKWMWKKTCLIQLAKFLPKSQELQQAIDKDYEGEGIERTNIDPGGPAVPKAFHHPSPAPVEAPSEAPEASSDERSVEPTPEEQARILKAEREGK